MTTNATTQDQVLLAMRTEQGLPAPVAEYVFAPPRRWRLDYAWPDARVALEVEGGAWTRGRHTRAAGFLGDMDKYNELAARGWLLVRCTPTTLYRHETFLYIAQAMANR